MGKILPLFGRKFSFDEKTTAVIPLKGSEVTDTSTGEVITFTGREVIKTYEGFHSHRPEAGKFDSFLAENEALGCARPSDYHSAFHENFHTPRVKRSVNEIFHKQSHYAWQEALATGTLRGRWRRYDLNQAYLWATTGGLPVVASFRASDRLCDRPGMYHVRLSAVDLSHPYPFNSLYEVNATTEEIDAYGLAIEKVYGGVVWYDSMPGDCCTSVLAPMSFAKQASKGFWGRWASTSPLECSTASGGSWRVENNKLNLVWAHTVVSRVKLRLWSVVRKHGAAHVYVDSVITRGALETGTALGEWKLEKEYPNGLYVGWPGGYGATSGQLDAHTGISVPRRPAA